MFKANYYFQVWPQVGACRTALRALRGDIVQESILPVEGYVSAENVQHRPATAFGTTNYLAVWDDTRRTDGDLYFDGPMEIYAARVTTTGDLLDPCGIFIATDGWNPSVAFDGTNFHETPYNCK